MRATTAAPIFVLLSLCLGTGCRKRSCAGADPAAEITNNHGHSIAISGEHVVSKTPGNYGIGGSAKHEHIVRLSKSEMAELERGERVTLRSTLGRNHSHDVVIECPR
jgi:hypothetical protein